MPLSQWLGLLSLEDSVPRFHRVRTLAVLLAAGTLGPWVLVAGTLDRLGQHRPSAGHWDAIVVAGCRVDPGGVPSPALRARTELAVALYRQGLAPEIAFTGGLGAHPPTEAKAAADHARSLGVPESAMVLEDRSTSTDENARFLAREKHYQRVLLVTDAYHTFRARKVFAHHFPQVEAAGSLATPWERIRGSLREVLAIAWYRAKGRIALFE